TVSTQGSQFQLGKEIGGLGHLILCHLSSPTRWNVPGMWLFYGEKLAIPPFEETVMPDLEALRQRVKLGDLEALSEFLEGYRPQLIGYIERRLGETLRSKVEPQDIFQEMALAAWNLLPKTDLNDREPFGWLCQIAEQRIIDSARKFRSQK